jgi:hypothetical protein
MRAELERDPARLSWDLYVVDISRTVRRQLLLEGTWVPIEEGRLRKPTLVFDEDDMLRLWQSVFCASRA